MVTRAEIVEEAKRWSGTPVRWKQCCRGHGVDCKMLPAGVAQRLGMPEGRSLAATTMSYRKSFDGSRMLAGLEQTLRRVDRPQLGDVIAIIMGEGEALPRHLGIVTRPDWMMHAYGGGVGRVCEVPFVRRRVHSFWTWPSLDG